MAKADIFKQFSEADYLEAKVLIADLSPADFRKVRSLLQSRNQSEALGILDELREKPQNSAPEDLGKALEAFLLVLPELHGAGRFEHCLQALAYSRRLIDQGAYQLAAKTLEMGRQHAEENSFAGLQLEFDLLELERIRNLRYYEALQLWQDHAEEYSEEIINRSLDAFQLELQQSSWQLHLLTPQHPAIRFEEGPENLTRNPLLAKALELDLQRDPQCIDSYKAVLEDLRQERALRSSSEGDYLFAAERLAGWYTLSELGEALADLGLSLFRDGEKQISTRSSFNSLCKRLSASLLSPGYSILDESAQFALLRRAQDLWAEQQDDKILEIIIRARLSEDVDALWSWYEEQEKALGHVWLSEFDQSRHYLFSMLAYRLGNESLFEKQAASWRASVQDRHSESSYSTRILALMRSSLSDPDSAAERWALLADDLDESNQQWREGDLARRLDLPGWIKSLSLVQS